MAGEADPMLDGADLVALDRVERRHGADWLPEPGITMIR
jgi:hypothetical protein